jgi:hypothetical protein
VVIGGRWTRRRVGLPDSTRQHQAPPSSNPTPTRQQILIRLQEVPQLQTIELTLLYYNGQPRGGIIRQLPLPRCNVHLQHPPHRNGRLPLPHMPQAIRRPVPDLCRLPQVIYNMDIWSILVQKDAIFGNCGKSTLSELWEPYLHDL